MFRSKLKSFESKPDKDDKSHEPPSVCVPPIGEDGADAEVKYLYKLTHNYILTKIYWENMYCIIE